MDPTQISWSSKTKKIVAGKKKLVGEYQLVIGKKGVESLTINSRNQCIKASVVYE